MKHKQTWRLRAEYVRWAALLSPKIWTGVPLEHCWIDGHSAYAITAQLVSADESTIQLQLPSGAVVPIAQEALGPEEIARANQFVGGGDHTPPPHRAACA